MLGSLPILVLFTIQVDGEKEVNFERKGSSGEELSLPEIDHRVEVGSLVG